MINLKMNFFSTLLTLVLIIVLSAACGDTLVPVTGNDAGNLVTLSECYQIRFLGLSRNVAEGSTTWQYQVEELPCAAQDLSEWIIEIPVCATIMEVTPSHWEAFRPDAAFQANGIKWKMDGEFQGGVYSVKLSGALMRGPIHVGINGSDATGFIQGPLCDPNAPSPTITLTPGTLTPTATSTGTARVGTTASPVSTATVYIGPVNAETEAPEQIPTKRSTSAPTKASTSAPTKTSTPGPTLTSTPQATEDSTPMPTSVTPMTTENSPAQIESTPVPAEETSTGSSSIPTQDVPTPGSPEAIPTLTRQSATATAPAVINITENDEILTYACHGNAVEISGNVNVVNLVGECSSITVTGNNNRVYWEEGAPVVEDTGSDNNIGQQ